MCEQGGRTPNKLQLLAFRQLAQNETTKELEYISKIPLMMKYFAEYEFIVTSNYHIIKKGSYTRRGGVVCLVRGNDLFDHIKTRLSKPKFSVNFWCLQCFSCCSFCYQLKNNIYHTHKANCKAVK